MVKTQAKRRPKAQNPFRKPRSGDVIDGRFRVVGRPLGKGGMGTVYRAEDPHGRMIALKRLEPSLRNEKRFEKRFRLEYEAAADLRHPNITGYQELFETDGTLFIAMELVDGVNLRQLMKKQKRLPAPIVAGVGRALARALEHLHAHRVVHRDIKPENVLVGRDGALKISDFGISRLEYVSMTRTGTLLGTPRYMSPEQLAGKKGQDIGPESDLYALGVVLYEMLTGKDPYRLPRKAEVLEVINVKHHQDPRPLPEDIEPRLRDLVMRLLQRNPEQRPTDARWVGQELGRVAASRKELRATLRSFLLEEAHTSKAPARMPVSRKKRESFWDNGVHGDEPEKPLLPPPPSGQGLFPIFVCTSLFFVLLWGIGLWFQSGEGGSPSKVSQAPRSLDAAKRASVAQRLHELLPLGPPKARLSRRISRKSMRKSAKKRRERTRKKRRRRRIRAKGRRRLRRRRGRRIRRNRRRGQRSSRRRRQRRY